MKPSFVMDTLLPISLILIMLGMGLSLVLDDFKRVFKYPKAMTIGLLAQLVGLPLLGFGVVSLFAFDKPELIVGLMILTFCPSGTTSSVLTFLAKGEVALSISLTAVNSILAPFTIPALTALALNHWMSADTQVKLPIAKTIITLLVISVIPVAIGMAIKSKWPAKAARAEKPMQIFSSVVLLIIIGELVRQNWAELPGYFAAVGTAALVLNVGALAIGFGLAAIAGLSAPQRTAISFEVGIQNGTTALLVTGTLLANSTMTIPPAIYSLLMYATGAFAVAWFKHQAAVSPADAAG